MKKMFLALFAVLGMVSCSNEEVIEVNREQIAFGEVFVDNATRADYSTDKTVNAFKVYGTVSGTQIFNGANVTRGSKTNGEAWGCDGAAQYWLPSSTYNFAAIVDGEATATTALPATIPFTVADGAGNLDLLYATATVTTDPNATPTGVNNNGVVAFDFSHLLSKLQFKIKNETNQKYQVTLIKVTGAKEDGLYTIGTSAWTTTTEDTVPLTFGIATVAGGATVAASEARQLLPVAQTLEVTINYDVFDASDNKVGELTKTGTITETFVKNTVYTVTAEISGKAINFTFSGTVGGWEEDNNLTI